MSAIETNRPEKRQSLQYYAVFHSPKSWTVLPKSEEAYSSCLAKRYGGAVAEFRKPICAGDRDIFLNDAHIGWLFLCQEEQESFLRSYGFLRRTERRYAVR